MITALRSGWSDGRNRRDEDRPSKDFGGWSYVLAYWAGRLVEGVKR